MISLPRRRSLRHLSYVCILSAPLALAPAVSAQHALPTSERAAILLNTARAAYNDQNYAVAADRFREVLKIAPSRMDQLNARYGLGLSLIEGPEKDYKAAAEALGSVINLAGFPDRPYAFYYHGLALRGMAMQSQSQAATRPATQAGELRGAARSNLVAASRSFADAAELFGRSAKDGALSTVREWSVRARCDQSDCLIRLSRFKEAAAIIGPILSDPVAQKSQYHPLALYYGGYAEFGLGNYAAAGKLLAQLAPFDQPEFGTHARYLLARTHQLLGERPEAQANYQAVITAFASTKDAPPYVANAQFCLGQLLADDGKYEEAFPHFMALVRQNGNSPLAAEGRLRAGICAVRTKRFADATALLMPLSENSALADQALRWLSKVPLELLEANATPNRPVTPAMREEALTASAATLRKAVAKATALVAADASAKPRLTYTLLDLADTQRQIRHYAEAAGNYAQVVTMASPEVAEQALQRRIACLQLAGRYGESDQACQQFVQAYSKSAFLADVLTRYAENALLAASEPSTKAVDPKARYGEALARLGEVARRFPDSPYAFLVKQGEATIAYESGQFDQAQKLLQSVPEPERVGQLSSVAYLLADLQLRSLPADAGDDAISVGRQIQAMDDIMSMLNAFVLSREEGDPQTVDAIYKIAYCRQRTAALLADPVEKRKTLVLARRAYATIVSEFPDHPLYALTLLELAKVNNEVGSVAQAMAALTRFQSEPLKSSPLYPIAMIHLGDAMRARGRAEQAVTLLSQIQKEFEPALMKDPQRSSYVPLLRFSLALAYKEAGRFSQARELLASIAKEYPNRPEAAEVAWRLIQCQRDQAMADITAGNRAANRARTAQARQEAKRSIENAVGQLAVAAADLAKAATAMADKYPNSDVPFRMNYDAAWCYRTLAEYDTDAGHRTEHEKAAKARYQAILDNAGDTQIASDAKYELAEYLVQLDQADKALPLLKELLENPGIDNATGQRVRLRLGAIYLSKNDAKAAAEQFTAALQSARPAFVTYAKAGLGEAQFLQKDWAAVISTLAPLASVGQNQQIQGVTDRAMVRLASAYATQGNWQASKAAVEGFARRFPSSLFLFDAQFALGQACEHLKQYDQAIVAYLAIPNRTGSEIAARALYQAGLCQLELHRPKEALVPLLSVAYGYDYPDWTAPSLIEAARANVELGQANDARKLLNRVIKEDQGGHWSAVARQRLAEVK